MRPRLLDLFCKAGGATRGYQRAGFYVVGVDIEPQPHYVGDEFVRDDAISVLRDLVADGCVWDGTYGRFDAVHASPPCQDKSVLHRNYGAPSHGTGWMLDETLRLLAQQRKPWVVENVVGAVLPAAIELCGATFGLGASGLDLNRHRRFACSFPIMSPGCQHRRGKTIGVYGHGTNKWHRQKLGRNLTIAEQREAMGIDWMNRAELAQAIPPAYTEHIGMQLMVHLEGATRERQTADALSRRGLRPTGSQP